MTRNYHISSSAFESSLQVETLRSLSSCFKAIEREFVVIGAASRDILRLYLEAGAPARKTKDLDIAIAVETWSDFFVISEALQARGFRKDPNIKQRFYYTGCKEAEYEVDVVPFGGVEKPDENIYWPPEESPRMSVKGFSSVLKDCMTVNVNGEFEFRIPSVPAFFVTKFDAWMDRHLLNNKDAKDMSYILGNYYYHEITEGHHVEVCDILGDDFDPYVAGAYMLAKDIAELLDRDEVESYYKDIRAELDLGERSRLLVDCVQGDADFDMVKSAWEIMAEVFKGNCGI